MTNVETRLDKIEAKLDEIATTLKVVAVQHEQITNLQGQMSSLWHKYDAMIAPDGPLAVARHFQASCPRNQIKWMWSLIIPIALLLLGIGARMVIT